MSNEDSKIAIIRKRKKDNITEGLDNTATVDELVNALETNWKKNKIYSLYAQAVRQNRTLGHLRLKHCHYHVPGHTLNVFSQDWDGGLNGGYFEAFSHKSLMPKMITTTIKNIEHSDPVTEYMKKKNAWQEAWNEFRRLRTLFIKKYNYKWINEEVLHCPEQFIEAAVHYENNPDPYFESSYNWYYAGHGNMQLIILSGLEFLLHSEFSCMYLSPFTKYSLSIDHCNEVKFDCGEEQNIFETISSQNIIALRTRQKVFVLKVLDHDNVKLEMIKEMESKTPFTGISFDEYHKNILYVTTLDFRLTIVNIDRMTGRSKQLRAEVSSMIDNWSTVIGSERGYFSHISKKSITLYDKRTNCAFQRWQNLRKITDDASCNDISVARHGTDTRLMYIGTDHHIFLLDLRYNKIEKNKFKALQRWTHGMNCLPTYMSVGKFEYNKELICMSSQWCEDMCVVSNYADRLTRRDDINGVGIPYRPPSFLQVLSQAKEKMLCDHLNNALNTRLCTSIVGLSVVEQDDSFDILMLNSLGDISCHTLCPKHMTAFFEDTSYEELSKWSKSYIIEPKPLEVTSTIDISNMWKELRQIPDDYKLGENKFIRKADEFNEKEIYEAFKSEELEPGLLELWTKDQSESTIDESSFNLFFADD